MADRTRRSGTLLARVPPVALAVLGGAVAAARVAPIVDPAAGG